MFSSGSDTVYLYKNAGAVIESCTGGTYTFVYSNNVTVNNGHFESSGDAPIFTIIGSNVILENNFIANKTSSSTAPILLDQDAGYRTKMDVILKNNIFATYIAEADDQRASDIEIDTFSSYSNLTLENNRNYTYGLSRWIFEKAGIKMEATDSDLNTLLTDSQEYLSGDVSIFYKNGSWELQGKTLSGISFSRIEEFSESIDDVNITTCGETTSWPGSLSAGTYYYKVAHYQKDKNAAASAEKTCSVTGSDRSLYLVFTSYPNTMVRIWRGTSSGSYDRYVDIPSIGGYVEWYDQGDYFMGYPWITSSVPTPPSSNTTVDHFAVTGDASISGELGIGTTSPGASLDVASGNINLRLDDNPTLKSYTTTNISNPRGLFVSGKYAYVADDVNDRLSIFNISDPDSIEAEGYIGTNLNNPRRVFVSGNYAYVASYSNNLLAIYDVSDPNSIVAKDTVSVTGPFGVYVSGKYAYVSGFGGNTLAIFDVSDPDNIVAKDTETTGLNQPIAVYVSGKYAYVANYGGNTLAIFDVSDPDNIAVKGTIGTNLNNPYALYVVGDYAYVASYGNNTLAIFDVSDPDNITAKDTDTTNLSGPNDVHVTGNYAYVSSYSGNRLSVFDISDPAAIVAKGSFSGGELSTVFDIHVSGKYVYTVNYGNHRLSIFEINNAELPGAHISSLSSGNLQVQDNAFIDNSLYVRGGIAAGQSLLVQGDGTISEDLTVLGNTGIGTASPAKKLEVEGGDIYIDQTEGKIIMKSPDGTCSSCGPDNSDNWGCVSVTCP